MKLMKKIYNKLLNLNFRKGIIFKIYNKLIIYTEQELAIKTCMDFIAGNNIEGDYLEFGVFEGDSFIKAFYFARSSGVKDMRFFAFDSFEGLPELKGNDIGSNRFFKGRYSCDFERFKNVLIKKKVDLNRVKIIKGWFNKVLTKELKKKLNLKKASYILIDCDLYESTIPCLEFVTDLIQDGTIIVLDDYFSYKGEFKKGERKAFEDWLKKNNFQATQFRKYYWNGESFIIHKKGIEE